MKNKLYDVCTGMTANLTNTLELIISTAGDGDRTHRSWQKYAYAKQIIKGEIIDTGILPIIHEFADQKTKDSDKIYNIDSMLSCNPVLVEDAAKRQAAEKELIEQKELNNIDWFRRFRLGCWTSEDGQSFLSMDKWRACEVPQKDHAALTDCPTYIGIDMSRSIDLSAICLWHELLDGRIYQQDIAILPADRLQEASILDDVDYCKFADDGELRVCDGGVISDEYVSDLLLKLCKTYKVVGVAFDRLYAEYIASKLKQSGVPVYEVRMNNNPLMTIGMNYVEELVEKRGFCHPVNKLYEWQLTNCRRIACAKDASKLVKQGSNYLGKGGRGRIDNIDASINAALIFMHFRITGDQLPTVVTV